jgi:hypothetical protein
MLSYVQKLADKRNVIKKYELSTGVSSPIIYTLPGQDYFCWAQSTSGLEPMRILLSSDGNKLYFYEDNSSTEFKDKQWSAVTIEGDASKLKGITRLAVNAESTKLAIVVNE